MPAARRPLVRLALGAALAGATVVLGVVGSSPATPPTPAVAAPLPARIEPLPMPVAVPSLAGTVIVIDPGHDGGNATHPAVVNRQVDAGFGVRKACNTTGTATADGYAEHAYAWDVAQRLADLLREKGARVVLTRSSDDGVGPCVDRRAAVGNRVRATLVVSIHGDGNTSPGARGFHVITAPRMAGGPTVVRASARLAQALRDAFAEGTGMPVATYTGGGRGITVRPDLGGLNLSRRPAVMVETGNMRHPTPG
ncbi:MAG: N-acetylmuramoyl-L-alanine amidase family protein [Angustibacter sp.]